MKKLLLYVIVAASLPILSCTGNARTTPADQPVITVAPAIEEPEDQTIGQRIDTANAALQRKAVDIKKEASDAADTAEKGIRKAAATVQEQTRKAAEDVKSAARDVKKEVKETAGKAAEQVERKAKAVKDDMRQQ